VMRHLDGTGCGAGEQPPGNTPPGNQPPPEPPPSKPAKKLATFIARAKAAAKAPSSFRGAWLSAAGSDVSADGAIASYASDFTGRKAYDTICGPETSAVARAFSSTGTKQVGLKITDTLGNTSTTSLQVHVTSDMVNKAPGGSSVYECSNPGANDQPDTADCIK